MLVHASCIAIDGLAVLLAGPPGIGKSDLALRLIDGGAQLIADDQTQLSLKNDTLVATAPPSIAGMIEIRHIGLIKMPFLATAPVTLWIDLVPLDDILGRMPPEDSIFFFDHSVRRLKLPAFAASTPAKIRAALNYR